MEVRQLKTLVAVAEHGTFSAAARSLHTVQSNVSTHIARLERELNVTLVDRSLGKLTAEGEVVVARARRIAAEMEALASDVASMTSEVAGHVHLGMIGTTGRWLTPHFLDGMAEAHPAISIVLTEATTASLLPQLMTGQVDLSVVNLPLHDADIGVVALFDEDLIVIAPTHHRLAHLGPSVSFTELAKHRLVLGPQGSVLRHELDAAAAAAGVQLQTMAAIDGVRLVSTLAFQGYGPAIVPATAIPRWAGPVSWVKVDIDEKPTRKVGLAVRRRGMLSAPAAAARDMIVHLVATNSAEEVGVHPIGM
ncbi:MAG: LysR family transcriptional regulator [Actinobacteria bacterium]|nr:LysR family transcriptional regulator [Actinomycetota bacterium]